MTSEGARGLGPLGRRLLAAFALVALVSVAVVTIAALIGTARGLDVGEGQQRQSTADAAADAAGKAYSTTGGWSGSDLAPVFSIAQSADAEVVVRDATGTVVASSASGMGFGAMNGMGRGGVSSDVIVDGALVGSVRLAFNTAATTQGQTIAWTWILAAAALALAVAFVVALLTSRSLTAPISRLSIVARAFAAGDRTVRPVAGDLAATTELGDLAQAFEAAAEDVERSEAGRRRLSADVAHELRTPLTVLQAGLEELQDGLVQPTPERLSALHDQASRLGRIVEDLAVLSAAETASFSLHRAVIDLSDLVEQAVAAARPAFSSRSIELGLTSASTIEITGDADRLHQAVGNLLGNAARYCRPGDRVEVTVDATSNQVAVTVTDTGPGIAPDDLPRVFDRLWRGSAHRNETGSGIGLAVVRELVEAHGGTVTASSDGHSGTTFIITLPR